MTIQERWHRAQEGEAKFHANFGWRGAERSKRAMYAAMMGVVTDNLDGVSVIDIGCGPSSMLLTQRGRINAAESALLDPLVFSPGDETLYRDAGFRRIVAPAETKLPPTERFDEAWIYNCLQHTMNPAIVLANAASYARRRVRIFEWLAVPTDDLHLHVLTSNMIADPLNEASFSIEHAIIGTWATQHFTQRFYAACWARR